MDAVGVLESLLCHQQMPVTYKNLPAYLSSHRIVHRLKPFEERKEYQFMTNYTQQVVG